MTLIPFRQGRADVSVFRGLVSHLIYRKHLSPSLLGFPFYTLGRFENSECMGSSNLIGTCGLAGECDDNGGIATGSCSTVTPQAVCCVCMFPVIIPQELWLIVPFPSRSNGLWNDDEFQQHVLLQSWLPEFILGRQQVILST